MASAFKFYPLENTFPGNDLLSDFNDALRQTIRLKECCDKYLLHYHLSQAENRLYILLGNSQNQHTQPGELKNKQGIAVTCTDIIQYLTTFHDYFARFTNTNLRHDGRLIELTSLGLQLFYLPFFQNLAQRTHVIFHLTSDIELTCETDLSQIYNLHYLLIQQAPTRNNFIVSQSSTPQLSAYVTALSELNKPVPSDACILFGMFPLQKNILTLQEMEFKKALKQATQAGANVQGCSSIDQLLSSFHTSCDTALVQVIGHFHYGRLIMNGQGIRLKKIVDSTTALKNTGQLHPGLIIDGINCTNFKEFSMLYGAGIKLVYASFNDLNILLMAYMLAELYSGRNARALGIPDPYLNGKTYLHEAYDLITRIFIHITCIQQKTIII